LATKAAFPEVVKRAGPYDASRTYYLWYVRTHTRDWLRYLVNGTFEMFYFIPYVTSVGSLPWSLGYLPAKDGVVPALIEDQRDVPYDLTEFPELRVGYGSLLNLRWSYLKLTVVEWLLFLGAFACLPAAVWAAGRAGDVDTRRMFLALLVYVGLGAGVRALIPTYGQALVVAYWGTSIWAFLYVLGFTWRVLGTRIVRSNLNA
jgi:hypothetical protein